MMLTSPFVHEYNVNVIKIKLRLMQAVNSQLSFIDKQTITLNGVNDSGLKQTRAVQRQHIHLLSVLDSVISQTRAIILPKLNFMLPALYKWVAL